MKLNHTEKPLDEPQLRQDSEASPGPNQNNVQPSRILVVDDQPTNVQVVGSVLGKLGHEIIPASDGPTAFKRLAIQVPST